jgi:hypothetical protein
MHMLVFVQVLSDPPKSRRHRAFAPFKGDGSARVNVDVCEEVRRFELTSD